MKLQFEEEQFRDFSLQQVQIVIRHGDRAPILPSVLPNVPPVRLSCDYKFPNLAFQWRLQRCVHFLSLNCKIDLGFEFIVEFFSDFRAFFGLLNINL